MLFFRFFLILSVFFILNTVVFADSIDDDGSKRTNFAVNPFINDPRNNQINQIITGQQANFTANIVYNTSLVDFFLSLTNFKGEPVFSNSSALSLVQLFVSSLSSFVLSGTLLEAQAKREASAMTTIKDKALVLGLSTMDMANLAYSINFLKLNLMLSKLDSSPEGYVIGRSDFDVYSFSTEEGPGLIVDKNRN